MKTRILAAFLSVLLAPWAPAADPLPGANDATTLGAPDQGQLEILLSPIALYPDALVALILPASTRPSEVVLASRFLKAGGKEGEIEAQAWDESIKALARFPDVVNFMDENLEWTQDVGDAFVAYPAQVMTAIQSLRARASRNGMLASTEQQEVVFEDDSTIRIVPAEREIIYVPYYDPVYLYPTYSYTYYPSSLVWFGVGIGIGSWLSYDCDWRYRTVWVNHHHHSSWPTHYDWRRRYKRDVDVCIGGTGWSRWSAPRDVHYSRSRTDSHRSWSDYRARTTRFDSNHWRTDSRRDSSATIDRTDRSLSRPETIRAPGTADRNGSWRDRSSTTTNRDRDGRSDRGTWNRGDPRPSGSLERYTGTAPTENVSPRRSDPSSPSVNRRNNAPVHTSPSVVDRRPDSIDRRNDTVRSTPERRDSPRPSPTVGTSRPTERVINSGADLRRPRQSVSTPSAAPAPTISRQSSPAPVRQPSYSPPPARQPSYSPPPATRRESYSPPARSEPSRSSSSSQGQSARTTRNQSDEN